MQGKIERIIVDFRWFMKQGYCQLVVFKAAKPINAATIFLRMNTITD